MKAMLASLVLAFSLLSSPGVALANEFSPAENAPTASGPDEIDVTGLSLSEGYGKFTGKLKIKAFVLVNGVIKAKVSLKGWILDANGYAIFVCVDDFLIVVGDVHASCDFIKVSLASIKVKVAGLNIVIRLEESLLVFNSSDCKKDKDYKKFCELAKWIHGKGHCFKLVMLLNHLWGFECDDDDDHDHYAD